MIPPRNAREDRVVGIWKSGVRWVLILAIGSLVGCSDDATPERDATSPPAPRKTPTTETASRPGQEAGSVPAPKPAAMEPRSEDELVEAGRSAYNANCIACHNMDPTHDGALGPAVAGSSYELIEARVMRAAYPEGYTPKRDTRVMVALPHLEPRLKELAAYLASLKK